MSGFIDPSEPTDARLDRLEALVEALLGQINPATLSTEAQILMWSLHATKAERDNDIRARLHRMAGISPDEEAR